MKINCLIPVVSTEKIEESKEFYVKHFEFQVLFANDWYVLLESKNKSVQIAFVMSNHKTQPLIFQTRFDGNGIFYTIKVDDADQELAKQQKISAKIEFGIRDEPWDERHFTIKDPNEIALNISQPILPTGEYAQ